MKPEKKSNPVKLLMRSRCVIVVLKAYVFVKWLKNKIMLLIRLKNLAELNGFFIWSQNVEEPNALIPERRD